MKAFEKVPILPVDKSVFDLSHEHKTTINFGELVPILCKEILPGDTFSVNTEVILKLQPLLAPIMHRINVNFEAFFVPNRLIWSDWEDFITKGISGEESPNHPRFVGTNNSAYASSLWKVNQLPDYLGFPVQSIPNNGIAFPPISMLPFRAYHKICDDHYINQNLQTPYDLPTDSNNLNIIDADAVRLCTLRKRNWEHDYFTSCLPDPQRGEPVILPLSGTAPVSGIPTLYDENDDPLVGDVVAGVGGVVEVDGTAAKFVELEANLSEATATTVQDVRIAMRLQNWFEAVMRFGAKYRDVLKGMFGRRYLDARLDRAEFLGGGRLPVSIAEVVQTSQTDTTPQGNMAGHGLSTGMFKGFTKTFDEHGFMIGIISIIPRTGYMQGLDRMFTRFDTFDYPWPQFMHIGEEPVKSQEVYLSFVPNDDDDDFGYQPRYMSHRCYNDVCSGDFKTTLAYWHMARKFNSKPVLNESFVQCVDDGRIFPVVDPQFKKILVMAYFNIKAIRPISKYATPM